MIGRMDQTGSNWFCIHVNFLYIFLKNLNKKKNIFIFDNIKIKPKFNGKIAQQCWIGLTKTD